MPVVDSFLVNLSRLYQILALIYANSCRCPQVVEYTCDLDYTFSTSGSYYGCCSASASVCSLATNCIGSNAYEGQYQLFERRVISRR